MAGFVRFGISPEKNYLKGSMPCRKRESADVQIIAGTPKAVKGVKHGTLSMSSTRVDLD